MTIEQVKRDLKELETLETAAWLDYEIASQSISPLRDKWYNLHVRVETLQRMIPLLEEEVNKPVIA